MEDLAKGFHLRERERDDLFGRYGPNLAAFGEVKVWCPDRGRDETSGSIVWGYWMLRRRVLCFINWYILAVERLLDLECSPKIS